ncbi:hypothetical protein [Desulfovibrio falkowii]|uniref:hypothetical protein n=1 Tax=Desulfovibrio sp. WGS1351 TaxID=3366814 RepID=UPI0002D6CDFA
MLQAQFIYAVTRRNKLVFNFEKYILRVEMPDNPETPSSHILKPPFAQKRKAVFVLFSKPFQAAAKPALLHQMLPDFWRSGQDAFAYAP